MHKYSRITFDTNTARIIEATTFESEPCDCGLCSGKGTHQKFSLYRYFKINTSDWFVSNDILDMGPYAVLRFIKSCSFEQAIPK